MKPEQIASDALRMIAGVSLVAAPMLPEPAAMIVRILGAAAGASSVAFAGGKTEAEVVAAIHRIRHLDTTAADAAVDALVDAKPSQGTR